MSVVSALLSRETKEGFELGNGPWYDEFFESLRDVLLDKSKAQKHLYSHMLVEGDWRGDDPVEQKNASDLATRMVAWLVAHPDWQLAVEFEDNDGRDWEWEDLDETPDIDCDVYKKTGSQYEELDS